MHMNKIQSSVRKWNQLHNHQQVFFFLKMCYTVEEWKQTHIYHPAQIQLQMDQGPEYKIRHVEPDRQENGK